MKKVIIALLLLAAVTGTGSATYAQISVGVSIRVAPPPLRVYTQPPCPYDGYIWTPGYWAYGPAGYYWIPGVWVRPPRVGVLWTPGYWGFVGGIYSWHGGYWGPHVGFYGGVNYGYGYGGSGFYGGMWRGNAYHYNTAYSNINTTVIHNTYVNNTYINNRTVVNNHSSFNGPGGITARPGREEQVAMRDHHIQATSEQLSHEQRAGLNRNQVGAGNNGHVGNHQVRQGTTLSDGNYGGGQQNHFNQPGNAAAQNHINNVNRGNHFNNAGGEQNHFNAPRGENHFNNGGGGNRQVAMQHQPHMSGGGMARGGGGRVGGGGHGGGGHGRH